MTSEYENFLLLLEKIKAKCNEFSFWKYHPEANDFSIKIGKNVLQEFQIFLKTELQEVSKIFDIQSESSVFLSGLLLVYYKYNSLFLPFLTAEIVLSAICFENEDIVLFENAIQDLKRKQIIEIKEIDRKQIEEIGKIDRNIFDRYLISDEEAEIGLWNKTFELTEIFINDIINL